VPAAIHLHRRGPGLGRQPGSGRDTGPHPRGLAAWQRVLRAGATGAHEPVLERRGFDRADGRQGDRPASCGRRAYLPVRREDPRGRRRGSDGPDQHRVDADALRPGARGDVQPRREAPLDRGVLNAAICERLGVSDHAAGYERGGVRARPAHAGPEGLTAGTYNRMVVYMQIAPPDFDRMFGALADATRRDIVRRAIDGRERVFELAEHYPMSFAAVQKHVAILERAGLVTKERIGRRKVVRANLEGLRVARRLLDQYEELWRGRIGRMTELVVADAKENAR